MTIALATLALAAVPPFPYAPEQRKIIEILTGYGAPPIETLEPRVAREAPSPTDATAEYLSRLGRPTVAPVGDISHKLIPGPGGQLLLRVYRPKGAPASRRLPVVVYFHGGGFVFANLNVYDPSCRTLANASGAMVVSVAYRLAPENKYPAAFDDAEAATKYVMANATAMMGDPNRVAIAGESAGGNLATSVCLRLKRQGLRLPKHQLLVYPVTDWTRSTDATIEKYAKAAPLNKPMLGWFKKHTFESPEDARNPDASPFLTPRGSLKGLPATTLVFAEIDPLRQQGQDYYNRLRTEGVAAEGRIYRGVAHEFFGQAGAVPQAKSAIEYAGRRLKAALR